MLTCAGTLIEENHALQLSLVKMMCHLAATPAGRSCIAASGCLPRWLPLAPKLPAQVQQHLLVLPLSCRTDWTHEVYFEPLDRGGAWVHGKIGSQGFDTEAYADSCPQLLKQQVCCTTRSSGIYLREIEVVA